MMSVHISAKLGDIAERVLFPGDPLRAKHIANKFLHDVKQYNSTRNMLGYTGYTDNNRRVSVQGSGMGMASLSIYAHELVREFGVEEIIRVGTCGAMQKDLGLGDVILAQGACSDSALNKRRFRGMDFAPIASWDLLLAANSYAMSLGIPVAIGNILSTDLFYAFDSEEWKIWAKYGVLGVEMESAELYTVAAEHGVKALSILTVSDSLVVPGENMSAEDREKKGERSARIALGLM